MNNEELGMDEKMKSERTRRALAWTAATLVVAAATAEVTVRQDITLRRGWNAVYMEVAPSAPLDDVFADWPVNSVGFYDPASFLATRQFSQTWDSQGLSMKPIAMWHRGIPEASQIKYIPAGTVCLAFSTNDEQTVVSVQGVPAAPRMTWHVTDTNEVYNFVGFSLQPDAKIAPSAPSSRESLPPPTPSPLGPEPSFVFLSEGLAGFWGRC